MDSVRASASSYLYSRKSKELNRPGESYYSESVFLHKVNINKALTGGSRIKKIYYFYVNVSLLDTERNFNAGALVISNFKGI